MKIITIGNGFIANHLPYPIIIERVETNCDAQKIINKYNPDIIINCIGFCGGKNRNIDGCESDRYRTFNSNVFVVAELSAACEKLGIRLIHLSSGCIFYGNSPHPNGWQETDFANPKSFYSKSKTAAEYVLEGMPNTAILRIRMPVSWKRSPRNLISKLISYKEIVETPNSITLLDDLSRAVSWVIDKEKIGTYHITSKKPVLHSEILHEYQKYMPNHIFSSITPGKLDTMVMAPRSNCILDSNKIRSEGFEFGNQEEMISDYMKKFVEGKE